MPRYVIERQYLVPMFEQIFVEAPSLEEACREAMDEITQPWSDNAELDFDNARAVTVAHAVELPEHLFPELRSREDEDRHTLSHVLYDAGLPLLQIPADCTDDRTEIPDEVGFA
jgi:hypothetical protein